MDETKKKGSTVPDEGKTEDSQKGDGVSQENFKDLQQTVSEKDVALKEAEKQIADFKAKEDEKKKKEDEKKSDELSDSEKIIADLTKSNEKLAGEVGQITLKNRESELAKKYPDIATSLIIDKKDDDIEKIVEEQRAISKKQFGDSNFFTAPQYNSVDEIDAKILKVQEDNSLTGEEKAMSVMSLTNDREDFNK